MALATGAAPAWEGGFLRFSCERGTFGAAVERGSGPPKSQS